MTGIAIDWNYFWSVAPLFLRGLELTLVLCLVCNGISIAVAYVLATILYFRTPVLCQLIRAYVSLIRNTPMLVQLFFFYFGLPEIGVAASPLISGIIVLTVWATAYQTENIRGAIEGLPPRLTEAGRSLGLRPGGLFVFVIAPVATRTVVPAMMNTIISATKNSALLSSIGVMELTYVAMDNIAESYRSMENFLALLICYLTIVMGLSAIVTLLERHLGRGYRR
ncbi:amino acid ABC transporter permease [Rhizobium sp. L1K21]|uniref:amino acid ABC transporter permease n=1 Tax=Rhizobium sp. L1K21 TaxID=2954933 RepID=UPI0020925DC1|nr:amino acid ABC transporter permease [Rhizobium sp. L1K21]MCO6187609.1 amino acid ABC transporter permease [Rhizobium sp. L1K21]